MKKIILIICFLLIAYPGYSAQFLYKDICLSGCDYTTPEAALNANEQDLTGDGWADFEIKDDWTVSMVLRNMFAGITWTQQLEDNRASFVVDTIRIGDFGELDSLIETSTSSIEEFKTRLPLVFHSRKAREDSLDLLIIHQSQEVGGVLLCFT